jgi:hypothetical protein
MNLVMLPRQEGKGEVSRVTAKAPACPKTTRYDIIAALQRRVEPAEDDWLAAIVVSCLRTRRMTPVGDVPVMAWKGEMAVVRQAS